MPGSTWTARTGCRGSSTSELRRSTTDSSWPTPRSPIPHKWLNAPTGIAATFVRDRSILYRAFTQEAADYLEGAFSPDDVQVSLDSMGVPYFDFGVELSSPVRGVLVWSILRELGADGVRARVVQDNDFARHVAARAQEHPRLELLLDPVLSICVFRYVPEDDAELRSPSTPSTVRSCGDWRARRASS